MWILLFAFMLPLHSSEIHLLAKKGDIPGIKALLQENPGMVNDKDKYGWTPLHFAALNGHHEPAELLFGYGAQVNAKDRYGFTPLDLAGMRNHHQMMDFLIAKGAEINPKEEVIETVPKILSVLGLRKELSEPFIQGEGDTTPTPMDSTQVISTIMKVREKLAKQRYVKGIKVYSKGRGKNSDFQQAAQNGQFERMKRMLRSDPKLVHTRDEFGITPLHFASINGYRRIVELLLAYGARINQKTSIGVTPLYGAVSEGQKNIVEFLIQKGADVNARTGDGATPLHSAPTVAVARLLISNGAQLMAKNRHGFTPLHIACNYGHLEVAGFLISRGANVNEPNDYGWTPLMEAVYGRHPSLVILLLEKGADVKARSDGGSTALKVAVILNRTDIADLLRQHEAGTEN